MSRSQDRIDEEQVCIDSLVERLKGFHGDSAVKAQEESDDPPDFWLTVGKRRFAVEVTSIVTDQGHVALCESLLDSIRSQYESNLSIAGTYVVIVFRRPDIPKRGSKAWRALVADALAGIKSLSESASGSEVTVFRDERGRGYLKIWKMSDEGATVEMCRTPEAKWTVDVQEELSNFLQQAIDKKLRKIQNKGVIAKCPDVILVLYDAYLYARVETAVQAFSSVKDYKWLHSIFWAASFSDRTNVMYPGSPGRDGGFLYSKHEGWR